jgi:hypothetical protein
MDDRFKELTDRLVESGNPLNKFSCSELHELYDGIKELEKESCLKITELRMIVGKCHNLLMAVMDGPLMHDHGLFEKEQTDA